MQWSNKLIRVLQAVYSYTSLLHRPSPNHAFIGATNGIAQLLVSIKRAIGPTAAASHFSLSTKEGYIGGNLVYVVFLMVSLAAIAFGTTLPQQVRQS